MDDVRISINFLVGIFYLEAILCCLCALSHGHELYFGLVLAVFLAAFDVCVDLLSKEELCHFLVDVPYCG